jgi:hypothetical protein
MADNPVLFVDVDGVISLFGFELDVRPSGRFLVVDGIPHFLSSHAGGHLRELAQTFELVWCTGWEEKANDYLPSALGLPAPLPHLTFGAPATGAHSHWKLAAIEAYAGSRAAAWIDDAHDDTCRAWAAERPAPTLLITTTPAVGMTDAHVAGLLGWAGGLSEPASSAGSEPR